MKNGKRYHDNFRQLIVNLYHSNQTVRYLKSEYGVSEVTVYNWIKKLSPVELENSPSVTPEDYAKLQNKCLSSNALKIHHKLAQLGYTVDIKYVQR